MVVEDGTGLIDSNSFVSLEYADDYLSARGVSSWEDLEDSDKEVLLIKATDYINNAFHYKGKKMSGTQALNFPRIDIKIDGYSVDGIPSSIKNAVCESAVILSDGSELFTTSSENGAVTSEKIGQLAFTYDVSQKIKDSSLYEKINTLLRGLYYDESVKRIISGSIRRS